MPAGAIILELTPEMSCGVWCISFDIDIREVLWNWISSDVDIIGMF